jgi:tocopherol cyclase
MKNILIILFYLFTVATAHSEVDPFNVYQWKPKHHGPWFEWWYYKVVLPETGESYFFVYGVVNPWDKNKTVAGTRAYVAMGDFNAKTQTEIQYPVNQFSAAYDQTLVTVGENMATDQNLRGELKDKNGDINSWDISIQKEWSYNATGWATGKGITNIEWYPAQASAKCSGSLVSHNKLVQFTDAPCYQDRNWGNAFPLWWTWIVSNQFRENPDSYLAVGGGRPKYLNTKFPLQGVSLGLRHKGKDYHFRPNDFDHINQKINFGTWEISADNGVDKVTVSAYAPKEKFMDLQFMTPEGKIFHDMETLTGHVTVKIYQGTLFGWKLIDTLTSEYAGIEYGDWKL